MKGGGSNDTFYYRSVGESSYRQGTTTLGNGAAITDSRQRLGSVDDLAQ
jgi:hypothetical protein